MASGTHARIEGDLLTLGQRARSVAGPVMRQLLQEVIGRVLSQAKGRWPVKTGRSRAGLYDMFTTSGPSVAHAEIRDSVAYARIIQPKALGGSRLAWDAYVMEPLARESRGVPGELARRVTRALAQTHAGGR